MFTNLLHISLTATLILNLGGMIGGESKAANEQDLVISKVNVSSEFICYSDVDNRSLIWERSPIGPIIYSINRINPDSADRFDMNKSMKPIYILTMKEPRLSDAGVYTCKREVTEGYLKQVTHIVVESDPVCDMSQDEADYTANASCTLTFSGNNSLHSVTWYSMIYNILTEMNSSLNSSEFKEDAINATATITSINSIVSVTNLTNGSYLICQIKFELPNYRNETKFFFNWTSPAILNGNIQAPKLQTTSSDPSSSNSASEDHTSQMILSSHKTGHANTKKNEQTSASKAIKSDGTTVPVFLPTSLETNWLVIGMTVAFVAIVLILIVVIICMYVYFRSKAAASRRRRAESSYAMPLPPELPRSTSYAQIDLEPIYNEPQPHANRESITSSHSYNYREKHSQYTSDAPPLPVRDMEVNQSTVRNKHPKWTSAEQSYDEDVATGNLIDPGTYLRMPTNSLHTTKKERSDESGYTLVPGDYGQNPIPLKDMPPLFINSEQRYEKIKENNDGYEHRTPDIFDVHSGEQKNIENNVQRTLLAVEHKGIVHKITQQSTPETGNRYTKIIHKKTEGYEKPVPEVPDHARYFPLTKTIGEDLQYNINHFQTNEVDAPELMQDSSMGAVDIGKSGHTTLRNDKNRKYLKLISDD